MTRPESRLAAGAAGFSRGRAVLANEAPMLALLAVLGAAILAPRLNQEFIIDQPAARMMSSQHDVRHLLSFNPDQRHPVLFTLLLRGSVFLFGPEEWAGRLPSVACGIAALLALFVLARHRTSRWTAFGAASTLAFNIRFVEQTRDVANISLFVLFAILSVHFFLRLSDGKGGGFGFVLCTFLMSLSNYFFVFPLAAETACFLWFDARRKPWPRAQAGCLAAALLLSSFSLVGLVRGFFSGIATRRVAATTTVLSWMDQSPGDFLRGLMNFFAPPGGGLHSAAHAIVLVLGLAAASHIVARGRLFRDRWTTLVCAMLATAVISTFAALPYTWIKPYYLFFLLPFVILLALDAVADLASSVSKTPRTRASVLAIALSAAVLSQAQPLWSSRREVYALRTSDGMGPLVNRILERRSRANTVLLEYEHMTWLFLYYGLRSGGRLSADSEGRMSLDDPRLDYRALVSQARPASQDEVNRTVARCIKSSDQRPFWYIEKRFDLGRPLPANVLLQGLCAMDAATRHYALYLCLAR